MGCFELNGLGLWVFIVKDSVAKWIRRLTTNQEIPGSNPGRVDTQFFILYKTQDKVFFKRVYSIVSQLIVKKIKSNSSLEKSV